MSQRSKTVAIIPARGGSKRVPQKNIIEFKGKPLIAWTVEAALESGLFDDVVVSTDCPKIRDISLQWGASVPFLRERFADDYSPVSKATIDTLTRLSEEGRNYEAVAQLFAACPLRIAEDIQNAFAYFQEKQAKFLISCYRFGWMNPWWAVTLNERGEPNWVLNGGQLQRSQDLPPLFSPTGAVWIADVGELVREGTFYGSGHIFWEMPWQRAIDIDTEDDVTMARVLFEMQKEAELPTPPDRLGGGSG